MMHRFTPTGSSMIMEGNATQKLNRVSVPYTNTVGQST